MSNIDERIVEMKFENHLFNKNVESSVGVLEKLKETLKFDGIDKNLSNINDTVNKIDFSKMASGITDTARAFSIKGTIIRTVIQDITRAGEDLVKKVASFGPGGLIGKFFGQAYSGGKRRAANIDQAKFQIEGLGFAWDDVANSIDQAVKGTAYGADSAAKAASQLLASGVAIGEAMDHALLGISGVAAMTNSSYDEIAPIFTTIAGQGKLMTMQLRQLESRGLNVAASLGKSSGKFAGKTEKEIRDLVTAGKIEFQDFADAMNEVFGEHAKDADKTFEGSLDNMKAAASRIGEKVWAPFREHAIPVFRATKGLINDINTRLTNTGVFDAITGAMRGIRLVLETIIAVAKNNLGFVDRIGDGIKFVANHIAVAGLHVQKFIRGFKTVKESAESAVKPIEKVAQTLIDVDEIAHRVINGEFGNGEVRFKALDELTGIEGSWKTIQNRVNELLDSPKRYADAVDLSTAATEKQVEMTKEAVSAYDKMSTVGRTATAVQETFTEAVTSAVGETEQLSVLDWAVDVFMGLKSAVSVVANTVLAFVKGAAVPLVAIGKTIAGVFGHVTGTIARWLTDLNTWMHETNAFEKIQNGINSAFTFMADILKSVGDGAMFVFDTIAGTFGKLGDLLGQGIERIKEFWTALKESEGFKKIKGTFESIGNSIIDLKDKAFGKVKGWVDTFLGTDFKLPQVDISSFTSSVSEKLSWLSDKIETLRTKIHEFLYGTEGEDGNIGFLTKVGDKVEAIKTKLKTFGGTIHDFLFGKQEKDPKSSTGFKTQEGFLSKIVDRVVEIKDKLKTFGGTIHDWLFGKEASGDQEATEGFLSKVGDRLTTIKETLASWKQTIHEFLFGRETTATQEGKVGFLTKVSEKLETIKSALSNFGGTIRDWLFGESGNDEDTGFLGKAYNKLQEIKETLKTFGGTVHDWLFGTEATDVQEGTEGFLSKVSEHLTTIKEALKGFGGTVHDFLFGTEATDDQEASEGFLSKVYDKIVAIKDALKTFGGNVVDWVADLFGVGGAEEEIAEGTQEATDAQDKNNKTLTKLKGIAKAVGSTVSSAFQKVVDWIVKAKDNVVEFWENFKQTEGYQKIVETFDKIKAKILELKDKAIDKIKEAWAKLTGKDFKMPEIDMGSVANFVSEKIQWLIDKVTALKEKIFGFFSSSEGEESGFSGLFGKLKEIFGDVDLSQGMGTFTEAIGKAKDAIVDFFKKLTESNEETEETETLLDKLNGFFGPIVTGVIEFVTKIIEFLGKFISFSVNFASENPVGAIMTVFGTFVGIKSAQLLAGIVRFVTTIGNGFGDFAKGFKKNAKSAALKDKTEAIKNLAIAIGILAASMWILAQIPSDKIGQVVGLIVVLTGAIAALMWVASKTIMKGGEGTTVLNPLQSLGKSISDFGNNVMKGLNKIGIAAIIISFALAIKMLVGVIKDFGKMDTGELVKGGLAVLGLATVLTAAVSIMSKMGKKKGNWGRAAMILALSLAVKMMAKAVKDLGSLNKGKLARGLAAITVIGAIFAGILAVTKIMGDGKTLLGAMGIMIVASGMVWVVAESIKKLADIDPSKLEGAAKSLTKVFLSVTAMLAAITMPKGLKDVKATALVAAIGGVGVLVAEVGLALWGLSELPEEQINKMEPIANALSKIYTSLGLMMGAIGLLSRIGDSSHKTYGIGAFKTAADVTGTTGVAGTVALITGIAIVVGAIDAVWKKYTNLPSLLDTVTVGLEAWNEPLRSLGSVLGNLLGGLVGGLINGVWETFTGESVGDSIKRWVESVKNFPEMIQGWIDALSNTAGKLQETADNGELQSSTEALESFDTYLGKYVDIANKILEIARSFNAMQKDYNANYEDAVDVTTGYQDVRINEDSLSGMFEAWANALGTFSDVLIARGFDAAAVQSNIDSAKDVLAAFGTLIGEVVKVDDLDDITDTINSMPGFADALVSYSWKILLLNKGAVESTKAAAEIILALTSEAIGLGKENHIDDGLLGWAHANGTYLSEYANDLEPFAKGLVRYSEVIKDMRRYGGAVQSTKNAVKIINALAGEAIDTGTKNIITSESGDGLSYITVLSNYSGELEGFATGMVTYSNVISGMNVFSVAWTKKAVEVVNSLASAAPNMDYSKGIFGWITGNTLEDLKTALPAFAEGLVGFSRVIKGDGSADSGFATSTINDARESIEGLIETLYAIQTMNTMGWKNGEFLDTDQFRTNLGTITQRLQDFHRELTSGNAKTAIESIETAMHALGTGVGSALWEGLEEGFGGDTNNPYIGELLEVSDKIIDLMSLTFNKGVKETQKGSDTNMFQDIVGEQASGLPDFIAENPDIVGAGETTVTTMATAITNMTSTITTAIGTVCMSAVNKAITYYSRWNNVGRNFDLHWAAGIRNNKSLVLDAVKAVTDDAIEVVTNMINTIDNNVSDAVEGAEEAVGADKRLNSASSDLDTFNSKVDDTMSNITSALAAAYLYINQVVQQAMDSTPTITPVLDLSQLQNGMGYMNSMIGQNQFLNSNLHYAMSAFPGSYSYDNTQMSYDNSSMIDALNGVREDIKTLGEEMSNMKMVLDSGALVGSIGTGVDQKLGNIQKFKERWA